MTDKQEKKQEIMVQSPGQSGLVIDTVGKLWRAAQMMVSGKIAPKSMPVESAFGIMIYGMELGMSPIQSLKCCCFINGRPDIDSQGSSALILSSGLLEAQEEKITGSGDKMECVVRLTRAGITHEGRFSMEDAKLAKLTSKDNWRMYPKQMLRARAYQLAARKGFSDILKGIGQEQERDEFEADVVGAATESNPFTDGDGMPEHMTEAHEVHDVDLDAIVETEPEPEPEPEPKKETKAKKKKTKPKPKDEEVEVIDEVLEEEKEALVKAWTAIAENLDFAQRNLVFQAVGVKPGFKKDIDTLNSLIDTAEQVLKGGSR